MKLQIKYFEQLILNQIVFLVFVLKLLPTPALVLQLPLPNLIPSSALSFFFYTVSCNIKLKYFGSKGSFSFRLLHLLFLIK